MLQSMVKKEWMMGQLFVVFSEYLNFKFITAAESIDRYRAIENHSGVGFFHEVGFLTIGRQPSMQYLNSFSIQFLISNARKSYILTKSQKIGPSSSYDLTLLIR